MTITGLTPYLYYDDADAALDWMEQVLGFTDPIRWRDKSGRTTEADIRVGPATLSISGGATHDAGGRRTLLIVHVDDVDAQHARVTEATGAELEAPMDQPYGPCTFTVTDPWGYAWCFWQGQATPPDDAIP
jgi:uncharacterized glyoxalase superfamily protein PhnB